MAHAGLPWSGVRASRYPVHSGRRPPSLSASSGGAPPCLSTVFRFWVFACDQPAPSLDVAFSSLFYFFALSAFACSCEVTVTSVSFPSFVWHRGLFQTNHRLSLFTPPIKLARGNPGGWPQRSLLHLLYPRPGWVDPRMQASIDITNGVDVLRDYRHLDVLQASVTSVGRRQA